MHRLTDISIRSIAPPASGRATYRDAGSPLQLRVTAGGVKTFFTIVGNGRRHTIGRFGEITLAEARDVAKRIRAEKTLGRYNTTAVPLDRARSEYLAQITVRHNTRIYYERSLKRLKSRTLSDITAADLNRILDPLPLSSRIQTLASFRTFFGWCVRRDYLDRSPSEKLSAPKAPARSRLLTDEEVRSIWNACEQPGTFELIVHLLILTGQRRGEIGALRSSYIKNSVCILPPALTKNGKEHSFPIGPRATEIIQPLLSNKANFLFPARGTDDRPFSGWSKSKTGLDKQLGEHVAHWTLHDLRRYYSSTMARLGIRQEVCERLLNHISGKVSGVAAIYNRYDFWDEMVDAVARYEAHVVKILT